VRGIVQFTGAFCKLISVVTNRIHDSELIPSIDSNSGTTLDEPLAIAWGKGEAWLS
jgi:hypothetical protein